MSPIKSTGISDEKFLPWLRHELGRALKQGLLLLVTGLIVTWALGAISPGFASSWTNFNYQLSSAALDEHPLALARTLGSRLRESDYGWKPLSLSAPFKVLAARQALRRDYPEVTGVFDGVPQVPRAPALKNADPAKYEARIAAYLERHQQIESGRFTKLYDRDDLFSAPNANVKLGLFATKLFGLPDAAFHTVARLLASGPAGVSLFATVLALSAVPLWRSRRPARVWLKLVAWPGLASALVWAAILIMAIAAAVLGGFSANTSTLALVSTLPLLFVLAKVPLHLAETLVNRPATAPWDGVERRKPRPPQAGTTPPPDGA